MNKGFVLGFIIGGLLMNFMWWLTDLITNAPVENIKGGVIALFIFSLVAITFIFVFEENRR